MRVEQHLLAQIQRVNHRPLLLPQPSRNLIPRLTQLLLQTLFHITRPRITSTLPIDRMRITQTLIGQPSIGRRRGRDRGANRRLFDVV